MKKLFAKFAALSLKARLISSVTMVSVVGAGLTGYVYVSENHVEEETEVEEVVEAAAPVSYKEVKISALSIEENLAVFFLDEEGQAITGTEFKVLVTKIGESDVVDIDESNKELEGYQMNLGGEYDEETGEYILPEDEYLAALASYNETIGAIDALTITDEDADGAILFEDIDPGIYQIWFVPVEGYFPTEMPAINAEVVEAPEVVEVETAKYDASQDGGGSHNVEVEAEVKPEEKKDDVVTTIVGEIPNTATAVAPTATQVIDFLTGGTVTNYGYPNSAATSLIDANGNMLYMDEACTQVAAFSAYEEGKLYYLKMDGWITYNGARYFYSNGGPSVGKVVSGDKYYVFDDKGKLIEEGYNTISSASQAGNIIIDVSKFNGAINWPAVKAAGINYAIIRCGGRLTSDRSLFVDPYYYQNMNGAIAAGLKVGVYFYSTATTAAEAQQEASLAVQLCQGYQISMPVFIDIESGIQSNLTNDQRTAVCATFCETVKGAGYAPGVYASYKWWTQKLNAGALSNYSVWIARYNTELGYSGKWNYWQYTSSGYINGINGKVDLNCAQ